jgi:hypothetical protein
MSAIDIDGIARVMAERDAVLTAKAYAMGRDDARAEHAACLADLKAERDEAWHALKSVAAQLATSRAGVRAQRMRAEAAESRSAALAEALRGLAEEFDRRSESPFLHRVTKAAALKKCAADARAALASSGTTEGTR